MLSVASLWDPPFVVLAMVNMYRIEVSGRVMTLNVYRNTHFRKLAKDKKDWQHQMVVAILGSKIPRFTEPISVNLTAFTKRKRDVDNGIVGVKYFLDALTELKLIADDGPDYVRSITLQWKKAKEQEKMVFIIQ